MAAIAELPWTTESVNSQESAGNAVDPRSLRRAHPCRTCACLPGKRIAASEALVPLTLVVMLTISTCAQSLFGLDGDGGLTRYRLLPIAGWQILAAKDLTFLLMALLLTLPLSPLEVSPRR